MLGLVVTLDCSTSSSTARSTSAGAGGTSKDEVFVYPQRCPEPPTLSAAERAALQPTWIDNGQGSASQTTCVEIPELPESVWLGDRETMLTGETAICVHPDGFVYDAYFTQSTGHEAAERSLLQSFKRWRYQPYVQDGKPQAFCRRMHVEVKRGDRRK